MRPPYRLTATPDLMNLLQRRLQIHPGILDLAELARQPLPFR